MDLAGCQCERWMEAKNGSGAWLVYAGNSNESGVRAEREPCTLWKTSDGVENAQANRLCVAAARGNGKREQREGKKPKRTSEGGCLSEGLSGNVFFP